MDDELEDFRVEVRDFAQTEIQPRAESIDRDNLFPPDLWLKLGVAGLHGITINKKYGGRGLSYLAHTIAMEEISRASGSIGLSYAAHSNICLDNLYRFGNKQQREHYIPDLCTGKKVGALAMSEPDAGSDIIGSMDAFAKPDGDDWIANGEKTWITNGLEADVLIVYLRTANRSIGSKSISAFLVDADTPGFSKSCQMDKLGMRGSNTCTLNFNNCRIPKANLLGEVNAGVGLMMQGLDSERLILAGGPIGIMQAALDLVLPWVHERKQFGKAIGQFELIQAKLADIYAVLSASRAYAYDVARRFNVHNNLRKDAAACLMFASTQAIKVTQEAIQILGGRGYLNNSPAGRLMRDAKVYEIGGGTNEIRHILIGRELFMESTPVPDVKPVASSA